MQVASTLLIMLVDEFAFVAFSSKRIQATTKSLNSVTVPCGCSSYFRQIEDLG